MTYTFKALNVEHTFNKCQRHYNYQYHSKGLGLCQDRAMLCFKP